MVKEIGEMLNDILMALESPTEKKTKWNCLNQQFPYLLTWENFIFFP